MIGITDLRSVTSRAVRPGQTMVFCGRSWPISRNETGEDSGNGSDSRRLCGHRNPRRAEGGSRRFETPCIGGRRTRLHANEDGNAHEERGGSSVIRLLLFKRNSSCRSPTNPGTGDRIQRKKTFLPRLDITRRTTSQAGLLVRRISCQKKKNPHN